MVTGSHGREHETRSAVTAMERTASTELDEEQVARYELAR
jgi:hypothetical protein